jgi:hypothetical protein
MLDKKRKKGRTATSEIDQGPQELQCAVEVNGAALEGAGLVSVRAMVAGGAEAVAGASLSTSNAGRTSDGAFVWKSGRSELHHGVVRYDFQTERGI